MMSASASESLAAVNPESTEANLPGCLRGVNADYYEEFRQWNGTIENDDDVLKEVARGVTALSMDQGASAP